MAQDDVSKIRVHPAGPLSNIREGIASAREAQGVTERQWPGARSRSLVREACMAVYHHGVTTLQWWRRVP